MNDTPSPPTAVVRSRIDRKRRLSLIWAIPIVTALIGAWLAWSTLSERGPLITIQFQTAEGLTAGQSQVRHKDVVMGQVTRIVLSQDLQHVEVTVRMNREAEPLLTEKASFWVVKPRFFAGSISGLQTLVSGAYIELSPTAGGGETRRQFVGLEEPPVMQTDVPGRIFLLHAPRIGSLSLGSPVFYRDLTVGQVLGWDVADMARSVTIHAFVRAPYDQYVHDNSRFWNASGASIQFRANGLQLQVESLRAIILGGIAFETPRRNFATQRGQPRVPALLRQGGRGFVVLCPHRPVRREFHLLGQRPGTRRAGRSSRHQGGRGAVRQPALRPEPGSGCRPGAVQSGTRPHRAARPAAWR
jgi:paraquat-inducible protein B